MIEKEQFNLFKKLFLFENRFSDEKANYFSITKNYLWRRDGARLAAYKMDKEINGHYNYLLSDLKLNEEEGILSLDIEQNGNIKIIKESGDIIEITPSSIEMLPNSLKTLFYKNFDWEFTLNSKSISKTLLVYQRKLMNKSKNMEEFTIGFDLKNKKILFEEIDEELKLECEIKKEGNENFYYSFVLFKDFLMSANSFSKEINFFSSEPYFTLIQYTDRVYTVLNHKRKIHL